MNGEDTLDAVTETDLAHGEAGLRPAVALDDDAFERLQAFLVAFLDLDVHTYGVAGTEFGNVVAVRFGQQFFDDQVRHDMYPSFLNSKIGFQTALSFAVQGRHISSRHAVGC